MSSLTLSFAEISNLSSSSDNPHFKSMLRTEMGSRVRQIVRTMIPSRIRGAVWMAILFTDAKIIGECATWICSASRQWRPRRLRILVPAACFFNFARNLARLAGDETYRFVPPTAYPLSPVCIRITLGESHKLYIYAAVDGPDGMKQTLQSSPFSHYRAWFDLYEVFESQPSFTRFQFSVADADISSDVLDRERTHWSRNGWHIYLKGGAEAVRVVNMVTEVCPSPGPDYCMPIVEEADISDDVL